MKKVNFIIESLRGINGQISSKRVVMYALVIAFLTVIFSNLYFGFKLDIGLQIQLCTAVGMALTYVFAEKKKDGKDITP